MSDETNGSTARFERIEQALAETVELQREMQKAQMRHEFTTAERDVKQEKELAEYRKQSEDRFARIESVLDHLTQLVGIFGDKTYEFDDKIKKVKEAL